MEKLNSETQTMNERINFIQKVILDAKKKNEDYVIKFVRKENKLDRLISLSTELPVMLFACNGDYFSAKCRVPQVSSRLRASDWMNSVANKLGSQCVVSKSGDPSIFLMKPIKIQKSELKNMAKKSEEIAKSEADLLLCNK